MKRIPLPLLLLASAAWPLAGQTEVMARAFEQERRGNFSAAAEGYAEVLRRNPDNLSALLGLERSLAPLRRDAELAGPAEALLERNPATTAAYPVAMRGWAAADRPDSVASVAARWAKAEPGSETPFREWGSTLLALRDPGGARRAYLVGRERLGDPAALAGELALLSAADNDWESAAREWALAIGRYPGYRLTARNALVRAPPSEHDDVLRQLARHTPPARRLGAELQVQWGDPAAAYSLLLTNLPVANEEAVDALRQFLDAARAVEGQGAALVRGQALEQIAARTTGAGASRVRLEAARSYADAGDPVAARRMLAQLAADGTAPPDMAASATATLVTVLLREGQIEEAQRQLDDLRKTLGEENAGRLTLEVADGWIRQGRLDRAEALLTRDSTVESIAMIGLIRLYRGDLAGAATALSAAGPFAGSREEATARTARLALIQPIESDSLPTLGTALLALARGDSAGAVQALMAVADGLPADGGASEIRLLAGRVEAARGRPIPAERLFRAASDSTAPATAPAAELELARLLLALGRTAEAIHQLEHLILAYPGSAAVPQARRLLDAARGGVPES
jgi:tetratricopeptide (TPR) repeat protein